MFAEHTIESPPEAPVDPGWDVDELLDVDTTDLDAADTLAAIRAVTKAEAMLTAKRFELMEAYAHKAADAGEAAWATDIIAAETHAGIGRVSGDRALGQDLLTRLPCTFALLRTGQLDRTRAWQVADAANVLSDEQCGELEQRIYPGPRRRTRANSVRC